MNVIRICEIMIPEFENVVERTLSQRGLGRSYELEGQDKKRAIKTY